MHFGNDTLDRLLDDKTQGENFVTLHQTEKTPEKSKEESTPRFVKKNFQKKNEKFFFIRSSRHQSERSERSAQGTDDQSYRSSRYSVDQSISLSTISGGNDEKSISLSEAYDSSEVSDPAIRNYMATHADQSEDEKSKISVLEKTSEDDSW